MLYGERILYFVKFIARAPEDAACVQSASLESELTPFRQADRFKRRGDINGHPRQGLKMADWPSSLFEIRRRETLEWDTFSSELTRN